MSFFSDQILSKRGPLGKVWLASHLERKLSKSALLGTSIPQSVNAIIDSESQRGQSSQLSDDDVHAMALRLSSQLLLGVARIYSRKAKYLMDDCNEALIKIKMAFKVNVNSTDASGNIRGADVNMLDDEDDEGGHAGRHGRRANLNINLEMRGGLADFDMLFNADPNFGGGIGMGMWDEFAAQLETTPRVQKTKTTAKSTVSRQQDITLPDHDDYDIEDPFALGSDSQFGIGSQEYRAMSASVNGEDELDLGLDLDLDLDLDLGLMNDDNELELGLDGFDDANILDSPSRPNKSTASSRIRDIAARAQERDREDEEAEIDLRDRSSSEVPSVELGRHAATPRSARDSLPPELAQDFDNMDKSLLEGANDTFDNSNIAGDFQPEDLTNDQFGFGDNSFGPDAEGQMTPRATSPEGQIDDAGAADDQQLTPRTAGRVAELAAQSSAARKRKEAAADKATTKRAAKVHKQIVDDVTELSAPRRGAGNTQSQSQGIGNGIGVNTREEREALGIIKDDFDYLPATDLERKLLQVHKNPVEHFFGGMIGFGSAAGKNGKDNMFFYAGPPGLPDDLKQLYRFSLTRYGKKKRDTAQDQDLSTEELERRKRIRIATEDVDIELGRERQSSLPFGQDGGDMLDFGGDGFPGNDSANTLGNDDFQLDLDNTLDAEIDISNASNAILGGDKTPSRLGTPSVLRENSALDESLNLDFDAIDRANKSVLAVFDSARKPALVNSTPIALSKRKGLLDVPGTRESASTFISGEDDDVNETQQSTTTDSREGRGKTGGWARNTVKALKILEHELTPREEEKVLSFEKLADKASRRAAASMFFETLILGTRDCLTLKQTEPYGDIAISGKKKLWEVVDGINKLSVGQIQPEPESEAEGEVTPTVRSTRATATPA